jgi:hypothetical protein
LLSRTSTGMFFDGAGTLRAVELVSSLRGAAVRRVSRWDPASLPSAAEAPASWALLLSRAREDGFTASGAAVLGVPSLLVYHKRLFFPFRGGSRIAQVLFSALEGEIPVPVERVETGHIALRAQGKGGEILAVACPLPLVEAVRSGFASVSGPARSLPLLQTDALGLAASAIHLGMAEGAALWVQGGAGILVLLEGSRVSGVLRLRGAGPGEVGRRALEALEEEGREGADVLLAGPVHDRSAARAALGEGGPSRILEGEDEPLMARAGVDDPGAFLPALGLALAGLGRGAADFDLLRAGRGAEGEKGWTAPRIRMAALAGLVLLFGLAGVFADQAAGRNELAAHATRIRAAYAALFPGEKLAHDTETAQLTIRIRDLEKKAKDLESGTAAGTDPLVVMGELSRVAPPELDLKLEEMSLEPGRLRLDGSLPGFDAIDQLKAGMESSALFSSVKVQNARVGASAGRVSFRMQAEVR